MELTVALVISIISVVMTILNFSFGRKDKSNKDIGNSQYKMGVLETKVDNILKQIDKILNKLDDYEAETDRKIKEVIEEHVKIYHKN